MCVNLFSFTLNRHLWNHFSKDVDAICELSRDDNRAVLSANVAVITSDRVGRVGRSAVRGVQRHCLGEPRSQ